MSNYWSVEKNAFVEWKLHFEPSDPPMEYATLLKFSRQLLALGSKHKVYCFYNPNSEATAWETNYELYLDYLEGCSKTDKRILYFMNYSHEIEAVNLIASSEICYFAKEGMTSSSIGDISVLLRQVYLQDKGTALDYRLLHTSPVALEGYPVFLDDERKVVTSDAGIFIGLNTDIWFPWVRGLWEDFCANKWEDMYDNRELALCHTPRLNSFLQEARSLTLEYGGTWRLCEEEIHYDVYKAQVTETGIKLSFA